MKALALAGILLLTAAPLCAATSLESIGAEKCGAGSGPLTVTFLAPEDATVEATAKARAADGTTDPAADTAALSMDGKACDRARCSFVARKGQSYNLTVRSTLKNASSVCISVVRP
jgi:hypothetical protein